MIDCPPTLDELSLNSLLISDLMLIPINSGLGTYNGIVDLQNTISCIANIDKRIIPEIKIIFNNIKGNENTNNINNINNWLKEKEYINLLTFRRLMSTIVVVPHR